MRLWPKSLLMRNSLLLIALVFATDILSIGLFIYVVQRPKMQTGAIFLATQIKTINAILSEVPPSQREVYLRQFNGQSAPPQLPPRPHHILPPLPDVHMFFTTMKENLPSDIEMRWQGWPDPTLWFRLNMAGTPYWISLPFSRTKADGFTSTIVLSTVLSLIALLIGYGIHQRINRPLGKLVKATQRIGVGQWPEPIPLTGPSEIQDVSESFNHMISRLADLEAQRATVLAGISHDIRTPLTKLRLALAMNPATSTLQTQQEFNRYFNEIDRILQQFIDFARGSIDETPQPGHLNHLLEALTADFAGLGYDFDLDLAPLPEISYRPIAMMRLLMNLMDNAAKYGKTGLQVASWVHEQEISIAVRDRGNQTQTNLERLKLPFQRGVSENSTPGSGLGLAIAEQIARQHGGTLNLHPRQGGGMEAILTLPVITA